MNTVLFVIDSLRADHLGCYGYGKNTSPNLDALARESVIFENAFAPGIPTTPAFTTLMTGLHPYRHGVVAHGGDALLSPNVPMLAQAARDAGLVTVAVDNLVVQGNGRGSWFSRGFDFYSAYVYRPFSGQVEDICDRALRFIREYSQQPFFLFVHLWDPHSPYGPPAPYDTQHYDRDSDEIVPQMADVRALAPEYYEAFLGDMKLRRPDDYKWIMAQYDGEISYVDAQIGRVLTELKTLNLWDETAVIAMADHGEAFGEGGLHFDHHGLYDAVIRVPLIWRQPNALPARRAQTISTEDIFPTLCDLNSWPQTSATQIAASAANAPRDENAENVASENGADKDSENAAREYSQRDFFAPTSKSFAPLLRGDEASQSFAGRDFLVGVESTRQASLCWRTEKWKLILPITHDARDEVLPDFYGNERAPQPLLYDLENDPHETRDVSREYSQVRDELLQKLLQWRAAEVARRGGDDPVQNGLGLPYNEFMAKVLGRAAK